ncbi:MAG: hypothetical protein V7K27_09985 [Nostoc sp.]|uniref:hypothetical protein n=1 Tax=Nostoc sp. TaxID=1180 RepID=UPI002FF6FE81
MPAPQEIFGYFFICQSLTSVAIAERLQELQSQSWRDCFASPNGRASRLGKQTLIAVLLGFVPYGKAEANAITKSSLRKS